VLAGTNRKRLGLFQLKVSTGTGRPITLYCFSTFSNVNQAIKKERNNKEFDIPDRSTVNEAA
jgi:hypothetical protein